MVWSIARINATLNIGLTRQRHRWLSLNFSLANMACCVVDLSFFVRIPLVENAAATRSPFSYLAYIWLFLSYLAGTKRVFASMFPNPPVRPGYDDRYRSRNYSGKKHATAFPKEEPVLRSKIEWVSGDVIDCRKCSTNIFRLSLLLHSFLYIP